MLRLVCVSLQRVSETRDYATSSIKRARRQCTMMSHHFGSHSLCTRGRLPLKQGEWAALTVMSSYDQAIKRRVPTCLHSMLRYSFALIEKFHYIEIVYPSVKVALLSYIFQWTTENKPHSQENAAVRKAPKTDENSVVLT